jgi:hypothetical protein
MLAAEGCEHVPELRKLAHSYDASVLHKFPVETGRIAKRLMKNWWNAHDLPYCMHKIEEENRMSFVVHWFVIVPPETDEGVGGDPTNEGIEAGKDESLFFYSAPHSIFAEPLSTLKNDRLRSTSFKINRFSEAIRPVSFCTSFLLYGGCIWVIALILSGFASMPFVDIRHPRTFPFVTPNTHFSGFNLCLASRMFAKVSAKSTI